MKKIKPKLAKQIKQLQDNVKSGENKQKYYEREMNSVRIWTEFQRKKLQEVCPHKNTNDWGQVGYCEDCGLTW